MQPFFQPSAWLSVLLLVCLSIWIPFCLSVYLNTSVIMALCLFAYLPGCSVCRSVCLLVYLFHHLFVCLPDRFLFGRLFTWLSVCFCVHLFAYLHTCPSNLSVSLIACLLTSIFLRLPVCPPARLSAQTSVGNVDWPVRWRRRRGWWPRRSRATSDQIFRTFFLCRRHEQNKLGRLPATRGIFTTV